VLRHQRIAHRALWLCDGFELYGILRAVGWGTIAVIGGCVPSWLFHYIDHRDYRRAVVTALAGAVCITVTVAGSMGGLAKSGDEKLAERRQAITAAKDDRAELERVQRDRDKLDPRPMGTIKAEIEVARAGRAYKATSGCDPSMIGKATRESCETFRRLEGDLAAAETAARLVKFGPSARQQSAGHAGHRPRCCRCRCIDRDHSRERGSVDHVLGIDSPGAGRHDCHDARRCAAY
jgi:hypothetical protein